MQVYAFRLGLILHPKPGLPPHKYFTSKFKTRPLPGTGKSTTITIDVNINELPEIHYIFFTSAVGMAI